jgi:hypothetical protein
MGRFRGGSVTNYPALVKDKKSIDPEKKDRYRPAHTDPALKSDNDAFLVRGL